MRRLVTTEVEQGVATVSLSHSPGNVLASALLRDLLIALRSAIADDAVRSIVLTGAGEHFSLGIDVGEVAEIRSSEEGVRLSSSAQRLVVVLRGSRVPTIAAINGQCLGAGAELALACHIRLAASDARLGQPEVKLALIPGMGGTQLLPRLVGEARALEILLSGDPLDADEAQRIGLVSHVVPAAELLASAQALARRLGRASRLATQAVLRAVINGGALPLAEGLRLESELFGGLMLADDRQEGCQAFLERRAPQFGDH